MTFSLPSSLPLLKLPNKPSHTNFEAKLITVDGVTKLVANLSTNKADGLDVTSARLLKTSFPFTAASVTLSFLLVLFPVNGKALGSILSSRLTRR